MKNVSQILLRKSSNFIFSVTPDTSVFSGLRLMMEKNISALLIMENEELRGIFTERDYARKVILLGRSSKDTAIAEVMTTRLVTVGENDSIENCMRLMTEKHIRHLPVLKSKEVVGMISIGDLVKTIIEDQKQTIRHLEEYING